MLKISHLLAFIFLTLLQLGCIKQKDLESKYLNRSGQYLGEIEPDSAAKVFASGIVSDGLYNRDFTMTPDGNEIYFGSLLGAYQITAILFTKLENGKWTKPEIADFASDPRYMNVEPFITPDGSKLFFASTRPKVDTTDKAGDADIWYVERSDNGWGKPKNLGRPVNSDGPDFFATLSKNGNIYFTRDIEGTGESYIYRSKFVDGKYIEPEKLGAKVNSTRAQFNAFISPNEDYMIIPTFGEEDSFGRTDYYISYRNENDEWSDKINLGNKINSASGLEYSPYVSPDGKYFFFMTAKFDEIFKSITKLNYKNFTDFHNKSENGNPDIFWIKADFIEELRPEGF